MSVKTTVTVAVALLAIIDSTLAAKLDDFRRRSENLYERVRALFFLYAIHRFHLPEKLRNTPSAANQRSLIPFKGYEHLLQRRFEEAIDVFLKTQEAEGPSDGVSSAPGPVW